MQFLNETTPLPMPIPMPKPILEAVGRSDPNLGGKLVELNF